MRVDGQVVLRKFEADAADLRHVYWFLRASRRRRDVVRHYRRAAKEKGRLAALGYDREAIRLYCLSLRRPDCEKRRQRFEDAIAGPVQLSLF